MTSGTWTARIVLALSLGSGVALAAPALAQTPTPAPTPTPPPPVWAVSGSVGFSLTQGNTDTSSLNLGYTVVYDPKTKNVVKSDGLFLRSKDQGALTANRIGLNGRDEYKINERTYVFGQVQYLRDQFKAIEYLVAPTGGLGYKIIAMPNTELSVDGGAGVTWEKDTGLDLATSGALVFGDKFTQKISSTTILTQKFSALWKTKDLGDALYITGLGVAASVNTHTQLKIEWLDTYKRKPPTPTIKPNDQALVFSVVFKSS